jgi:hypothetical protein
MANELKRTEIGFDGGQVVTVRITDDALSKLRNAVERDGGWYDLETEDGTVALHLPKVVFVRIAGAPHTIGFSGS